MMCSNWNYRTRGCYGLAGWLFFVAANLSVAPLSVGQDQPTHIYRPLAADAAKLGAAYTVSEIGDLNSDGTSEVVVGYPYESSNAGRGGFVVYSGSDASVLHTTLGVLDFGQLGTAVSAAGDVNSDLIPDYVVTEVNDVAGSGLLHIYSGADHTEICSVSGGAEFQRFGSHLSRINDLNSDGVADLVVADARFYGRNGNLIFVSAKDCSRISSVPVANLAGSIAVLSDIDGDGLNDVAVGRVYIASSASTFAEAARSPKGGLLVVSPKTGETLFSIESSDHVFGRAVVTGQDINGDTFKDFYLAGLTKVFLFSGKDGTEIATSSPLISSVNMDTIHAISDIDGDGINDIEIQMSGHDVEALGSFQSLERLSGRTLERLDVRSIHSAGYPGLIGALIPSNALPMTFFSDGAAFQYDLLDEVTSVPTVEVRVKQAMLRRGKISAAIIVSKANGECSTQLRLKSGRSSAGTKAQKIKGLASKYQGGLAVTSKSNGTITVSCDKRVVASKAIRLGEERSTKSRKLRSVVNAVTFQRIY